MMAEDRNDAALHDVVTRRCTMCGREKPVPPGTEAYARAHRGEAFPFTCPECEEKAQIELEVAGGTADDPLSTQ